MNLAQNIFVLKKGSYMCNHTLKLIFSRFCCVTVVLLALLPTNTQSAQQSETHFTVYYFHRTIRCQTCTVLEEFTNGVVENYFKNEILSGLLVFEKINIDLPENIHYEDHYNLNYQSVIISEKTQDRELKWKNCPDIWKTHDSKEKFENYLRKEITEFIDSSQKNKKDQK